MNILYLHGLKSKLSEEKREEKYGNVFAPDIDYSGEQFQVQTLSTQLQIQSSEYQKCRCVDF